MPESLDSRNIRTGTEIPGCKGYCDQPYLVRTDDGAWLCVMTVAVGHEGSSGQHVIALRSTDCGRTWADRVALEPADGPEASYAVLLKAPGGRIYCFYNHNTDNRRWVKADDPPFKGGKCTRVDSLGHFVFKYSDDHGRTWCAERTDVPMREMDIDRRNTYGGQVRFFWNVGKPFIHQGAAYVSVHKVGGFGHGFFTRTEGVLLRSANLLTESDPREVVWETLPDGDFGLRTPPGGGPISEEQSYSVLSDGSFYCVYRTIDGHPTSAYSRDAGRTWNFAYKQFANGRRMKHPRAANFAWKCANGKYLYWFHNHGGTWYDDRNPVWLSGGVEADSPAGRVILWSQPEIVLYDDDPYIRMSYPDLIEDGGRYYLTETQKAIGRVHEIDTGLIEGLWVQFEGRSRTTRGLVLDLPAGGQAMPREARMPKLPEFTDRDNQSFDYGTKNLCRGFALDFWCCFESLAEGQVLLDTRNAMGQGLCLRTTGRGTVEIVLNDGRTENTWDCDPGMLKLDTLHHVTVSVDGGPKIITFVVDGVLCDGGAARQFGWGRFSPNLRGANGAETLRIAPRLLGELRALRIYDRSLRTSEAVANFRAGV